MSVCSIVVSRALYTNIEEGGCLTYIGREGGFLLATGERMLVEASPTDAVWGIGLAENDPLALDPNQWRGLNLLGFALMKVREQLGEVRRA
jgi:hypothetical protein